MNKWRLDVQANLDRKIKVLIVEDCRTVREYLEHLIARDPRLEVAASVSSGEEALALMQRIRPDVISLDIRLPGIDGFAVTREVMSRFPTPIVVCSASVDCAELNIAMNALRAGALSVVEKPRGIMHGEHVALAERLCTQLTVMSQVSLVRQRMSESHPVTDLGEPQHQPGAWRVEWSANATDVVIGIAASTGGPNALAKLLGALPANFAAPILLVQHITAAFSKGFVDWLGTVTPLRVIEVQSGMRPEPGCVYVAPADRHLVVAGETLRLLVDMPVRGQRPSASVLFRSMAAQLGKRAVGVILTGMGDDGADGLRDIRDAGGFTVAESAESAVVYGMPAAAVKLNAACESLPLACMPRRLCQCIEESAVAMGN